MKIKNALKLSLTSMIALLALLLIGSVMAQDEMQSFTIEATEDGIIVPETVDAGWAEITFDNATELPFYSIIGRLDDDVTVDEFMGSLMGVMSGESADVPLATLLGSPLALPEATEVAMYNLEPGNYVVLSVAGEMPDMATFVVEGEVSDMDIEVDADLTVPLVDFAFGIPEELEAGEQVWIIENLGEQWHEMAILSVPDGTTLEDAMMMMAPEEMEEDVDAEESAEVEEEGGIDLSGISFLWSPMSEEGEALVMVDLEPGTYLVTCFLPDTSSEEMASHLELGMVQIITVVGETEDTE